MFSRNRRNRHRPFPDRNAISGDTEMSIRLHQNNPTLATALEWLDKSGLGEIEKRDPRSTGPTACRWFGKKGKPHEVPADPKALRGLFEAVPAGAVGRTKKRRANVKWGIGRLLRLPG